MSECLTTIYIVEDAGEKLYAVFQTCGGGEPQVVVLTVDQIGEMMAMLA